MSYGSINIQGNTSHPQVAPYGTGMGGSLYPGAVHTTNNMHGSATLAAFAAAAFSGVYASDLSLVLSDQEKVAKAWDFAEMLLAEGQKRGHNFY